MFYYHNDVYYAEKCALPELKARFGSPLFVYSKALLKTRAKAYLSNPKISPFYAVKANDRLAILSLMKEWGLGFAVVSKGELLRLQKIGADPKKIVFSGSGKRDDELLCALEMGIAAIQAESMNELERLGALCESSGLEAAVALRLNFDVATETHPHLSTGAAESKFGIPEKIAPYAAQLIAKHPKMSLVGLSTHAGSMIQEVKLYSRLLGLLEAKRVELGLPESVYLNVGGGAAVRYTEEHEIEPEALLLELSSVGVKSPIYVEPGRSIAAASGGLLTEVISTKQNEPHRFVFLDAGMNDLIRPALYGAHHAARRVELHSDVAEKGVSLVGPLCESADKFSSFEPLSVRVGDLIFLENCGAYGSTMSSNYNNRPRAAEVLVEETEARLIVRREEIEELWSREV